MRWAKEDNLPVFRLAGGKQGHVCASRSAIDAWAFYRSAGLDFQSELAKGVGQIKLLTQALSKLLQRPSHA